MPENHLTSGRFNRAAMQLWKSQLLEWPQAGAFYATLNEVLTKSFHFGDFRIDVQYNPARIKSTGAKIDAKSISERPCFLCGENLPAEQRSVDAGEYSILVNPYPIFPQHFTIPLKKHAKQQIKDYFADFLLFAQQLDQFIVFYNGPRCGASAPDHLHFQAGTSGVLPLENDYKRLRSTHRVLLREIEDAQLWQFQHPLIRVICIESTSIDASMILFQELYSKWQQENSEVEPMMNLIAFYEESVWTTFMLPRSAFRPRQFYLEGDAKLMISPGSVEMGGLMVIPLEEHFLKINAEDVDDIYHQISFWGSLANNTLEEPVIKVGIMAAAEVRFLLNGKFACNNNIYSGPQIATITSAGIMIDGIMNNEWLFEPITSPGSFFELQEVVIGVDFHWERKENQQFEGSLQLMQVKDKIQIINHVRVEDYLLSVISSEMSAEASPELLKAHAVISRSWLLHPMLHPLKNGMKQKHQQSLTTRWYERDAHELFDVCADDHCQRYQGVQKATTLKVREAVKSTRGMVLMYGDEVCDARYYKACGGVTEEFEHCWADKSVPYLKSVYDGNSGSVADLTIETNANEWIRSFPPAFCNTNDPAILTQVLNHYDQETVDFYRWQVEYSTEELSSLIFERSGIDFGTIEELIPIRRGPSGRISQLKIVGSKRTLTVGKELEIRKWLSPTHLYSSAFVVDKIPDDAENVAGFRLTGAGWGHGVGLCQIGASVMSGQGYTYHEILKHYFNHGKIEKIY